MTKALVHKRGKRRVNEIAFRCGPTGETNLACLTIRAPETLLFGKAIVDSLVM